MDPSPYDMAAPPSRAQPSYAEAPYHNFASCKEVAVPSDMPDPLSVHRSQRSDISSNFKPCAIPQLTEYWWAGLNCSPFARAFPPAITAKGICQREFMHFVDAVKEACLVSPAFNYSGLAGGLAAIGLSYVSIPGIRKMGQTPVGLHAQVLRTDMLMPVLGHTGENVWERYERNSQEIIGAEESFAQGLENGEEHGRVQVIQLLQQRMAPLEPSVTPLTFDVGPPTKQDGTFKKWSAAETTKNEKIQMRLLQQMTRYLRPCQIRISSPYRGPLLIPFLPRGAYNL
ncbi:hypothetical protein N7492_008311 [Penicillium capsulatum]|uniref:Uncharacterized protein n=1 Tax=Penicillium capsulatum TaxID=69766 RepID=A0A9W9HRW6_9EURO|nr:hypothetical protein N7492_008311 [Penicillium capsulatum]KAJ6105715.1 hypothetical protein N7512_009232 [Penicillium capsulatum]